MSKHKKKKNKLKKGEYRFIKISAEALYEYVCESIIRDQEEMLDVDSLKVANAIAFDPKSGSFVFCAYRSEDKDGNRASFPKSVDINRLLKAMPDTTNTMLSDGIYQDYTEEDLIRMQRKSRKYAVKKVKID